MSRFVVAGVVGALLLAPASGRAQTAVPPTSPDAPAAKPNEITPPNGVPRGVIRPNRPVDSGVVIRPPTQGNTMPVIKPPGTSR